jgi:autotransporter-associated beta strand protein
LSLAGDAATVSIGNNNQSTTYSAVLSNTALNKIGTGTLAFTGANTYGGLTTVSGGTLELGTAAARHPVFDLGGANIQNDWSKLVFDYTSPSDDPAAQIASILQTSYGPVGGHPFSAVNGGKIFSSTAESAGRALGWSDNGTNQVTVMYTMYGDANLDGAVDFSDLTSVLANYDSSGTWATGDFNYDGVVDFSDLTSVLANYDQSLSGLVVNGSSLDAQAVGQLTAAGVKVVPEPGTLALLAAGLIGLLACGWRSRR